MNFKFDPKLTAEETDSIQFALDNLNHDHEVITKSLLHTWESEERIKNQFANEFGGHEVADRAFLAMEQWHEYIENHPVVVMDKKAFRLANVVTSLMHEVYQIVGCKYPEEEEKEEEIENWENEGGNGNVVEEPKPED